MNVKAFSQCPTPMRFHFFALLFIPAHAYKISAVGRRSRVSREEEKADRKRGRKWRWRSIALATFMAYSELIALSFSHFIVPGQLP